MDRIFFLVDLVEGCNPCPPVFGNMKAPLRDIKCQVKKRGSEVYEDLKGYSEVLTMRTSQAFHAKVSLMKPNEEEGSREDVEQEKQSESTRSSFPGKRISPLGNP